MYAWYVIKPVYINPRITLLFLRRRVAFEGQKDPHMFK